jgi:hypothetical protein
MWSGPKFKILSLIFPDSTEANHENYETGKLVPWLSILTVVQYSFPLKILNCLFAIIQFYVSLLWTITIPISTCLVIWWHSS